MAGLSKGLTLRDIAKKHDPKGYYHIDNMVDVLKKELKKGIKVEHEHTGDVKKAARIAMDHLVEDPNYYTKLAKLGLEENINVDKQIFESNPELASIGTLQQYSNYLSTIFPNSKVKDIVYRGDRFKYDAPKDLKIGIYFTLNKRYAQQYGGNITLALINTNEPLYISENPQYYWNRIIDKTDRFSNYDSIIYNKGEEIIISSQQVYILGSKQDIEGFTQYIKKKPLNENQLNKDLVKEFMKHVKNELKLDSLPKIKLSDNSQEAIDMRSWGGYQPLNKSINIVIAKRHPADIFRTLAHELVHYKQDIEGRLKMGSGSTGSEHENEANSKAAIIMRNFAQAKPNLFEHLINEIGEITNPYKWYLDYIDDEGNYYFKFSTPQNEYSVVATQEPSEYDVYNLTFSVGGSFTVETNEGVVLRVLSTIADIALDVLKKTEASKILIYPTKDENEKSSRRFNVYKPFIMKNIPYPYELEISDGTYIITKNDSYAKRNNS
jgi:hypothetical protein